MGLSYTLNRNCRAYFQKYRELFLEQVIPHYKNFFHLLYYIRNFHMFVSDVIEQAYLSLLVSHSTLAVCLFRYSHNSC